MISQRISNCFRKSFEPSVQNGLSVTPSLMSEMSMKGIPVSSQNLALSFDSNTVPYNDFSIPVDFQRGVDIAEVWEQQKSARKKFMSLRKQAVVESQNS